MREGGAGHGTCSTHRQALQAESAGRTTSRARHTTRWLQQPSDPPPLARKLAVPAGIALVSLSGWLGGDTVYRHGVGVAPKPLTPTYAYWTARLRCVDAVTDVV